MNIPQVWNPYNELRNMQNFMDRWMSRPMWSLDTTDGDGTANSLPLDIYADDGHVIVEAAVPGFAEKDIDITFDNGILTIRAEASSEKKVDKKDYLLREYSWGSTTRSVRLPADLDADHADAKFDNGKLRLTIPRKAGSGPKRIDVHT